MTNVPKYVKIKGVIMAVSPQKMSIKLMLLILGGVF